MPSGYPISLSVYRYKNSMSPRAISIRGVASLVSGPLGRGGLLLTSTSQHMSHIHVRLQDVRQRCEPEVRLDNADVREHGLSILSLDGRVDDDIVTRDPVDGSCDLVLVAGLQAVEDAEDFGCVATSAGGV